MKLLIYILIATLPFSSAFSNPIKATIVFENLTEKTSISGMLYITETNQTFHINSLDKFVIELPKKGKYQFRFYSEDVKTFIYYPARITEIINTVTIRLENKTDDLALDTLPNPFPTKNISNFSMQEIEEAIATETINFIVHGLISPNPEAVKVFKSEYSVGFISENCVVDPISFKIAMDNNKKIDAYLTSKFGHDWKNKLPAQPFGL